MAAAAVNGKIYACGGLGVAATSDTAVEEYDPSANTWQARTSLTHGRSSAGAFGWNGKIYVTGGIEGGVFVAATEEFDPQFNGWSPRADMLSLRRSFGYANIGPSCYCFGGVVPGGTAASFTDQGCHEYFAYTVFYPFKKN